MPSEEHLHITGARTAEIHDAAAVPAAVQQMFDEIAPRYDLLNHLLSAGLDRRWWKQTANTFREVLGRPESVAVDLCCGTGDMTLALDALRPKTPDAAAMLAVDFSHEMLQRAAPKFTGHNIQILEADALHLPLADASADLVTSAFGFRNLASYEDGLAEIFRVLRPGGYIGILDCNQPGGLRGALYSLYFHHIVPLVGGLISGKADAYRYLPASVERFPRPPRMIEMMQTTGFQNPVWHRYTLGAAGLYVGQKPA